MAIEKRNLPQGLSLGGMPQGKLQKSFTDPQDPRVRVKQALVDAREAEGKGQIRKALNYYYAHRNLACDAGFSVDPMIWGKIVSLRKKLQPHEKNLDELTTEEVGQMYDRILKQQQILLESGEYDASVHRSKFSALPRTLFGAPPAPLWTKIPPQQNEFHELEEHRLELLRVREDLKQFLEKGETSYGLQPNDWTYQNFHQVDQEQNLERAKQVYFAGKAPLPAPPAANRPPIWAGQKAWGGKIREMSVESFIFTQKPKTCEIDLDIPPRIAEKGFVVVIVGATWCAPCQLAQPGFEKFAEKYSDIKVYHTNVLSEAFKASEDPSEVARTRGQGATAREVDWAFADGVDAQGTSRLAKKELPTVLIYNDGILISEQQGGFIVADASGEPVFNDTVLETLVFKASDKVRALKEKALPQPSF